MRWGLVVNRVIPYPCPPPPPPSTQHRPPLHGVIIQVLSLFRLGVGTLRWIMGKRRGLGFRATGPPLEGADASRVAVESLTLGSPEKDAQSGARLFMLKDHAIGLYLGPLVLHLGFGDPF